MPCDCIDIEDPRVQSALAELQERIKEHYPTTQFQAFQGLGDDSHGIYLMATVDTDDDILDVVIDRLLYFQDEAGLPVYVLHLQTPGYIAAELASRPSRASVPAKRRR